jgi:hypothetical protein
MSATFDKYGQRRSIQQPLQLLYSDLRSKPQSNLQLLFSGINDEIGPALHCLFSFKQRDNPIQLRGPPPKLHQLFQPALIDLQRLEQEIGYPDDSPVGDLRGADRGGGSEFNPDVHLLQAAGTGSKKQVGLHEPKVNKEGFGPYQHSLVVLQADDKQDGNKSAAILADLEEVLKVRGDDRF